MKRLIVCCDGTWNTPDQHEDGESRVTNVRKIASAILPTSREGIPQIVFYHAGVGASLGFDLSHWIGGAFGAGLSEIILTAYRFLVDNYEEDDQLFFFGFSRGAYAVRSLAGFIRNCGIVKKLHDEQVAYGYGLYKRGDESAEPEGEEAVAFRELYAHEPTIHCLGVWDTVGALGIPGNILARLTENTWQFHDVKLSRIVRNAYQALALDEQRSDFQATLWEQQPDAENQVLEQVWFPGVHGNVGGGYIDAGLSDIALLWIIEKAQSCGLSFSGDYIARKISPMITGTLRDSRTGFFYLRPRKARQVGMVVGGCESVHWSVDERIRALITPEYRPINISQFLSTAV
jgi:uncharacterized protein (DUF2235 family)